MACIVLRHIIIIIIVVIIVVVDGVVVGGGSRVNLSAIVAFMGICRLGTAVAVLLGGASEAPVGAARA